jgi:hypothetical protein
VSYGKQTKRILERFGQLYGMRRKALPPSLVNGLVLSILTGELTVNVDEAEYSPLREVLPLLREAQREVMGVGS